MLKVKEIHNKTVWESFLKKTPKDSFPFFQTWNWGEVQKKLGFSVLRWGVFDEDKLVGVAQVVEIHAKRGKYLHFRHGPVFLKFSKSYLLALLKFAKEYAKENSFSFLRISPLLPKTDTALTTLQNIGFRDAPIHNMDAEICWVLDITKSEDELLSGMRKSHRYLIKKGLKEPIEIKKIESLGPEIMQFLEMYKKLAQERKFVAHKGLVEEVEILGKDNQAVLFVATYDGKIVGGALIDFVGPMAVYHHGAMDEAYRNLPISHLLQWEAIKEAKKRGKILYNFWGIAENESKKHPWHGLTLFKTGFGGEKEEFIHAQDLPLSLWYWKTYLIDMLTKIRKGY